MASGVLNFPQLTSATNFNNWKFRFTKLLEERQISQVLVKTEADFSTEKEKSEFKANDSRGKSIIVQCLTDKHLELVKDAKTAKDMIKALEDIFERKSVFTKLTLKRKLLTLKIKRGEKLENHFFIFDTLIRDLENAGSKLDEEDKVCHLLFSLNEEYESVIKAIETMNKSVKMEFVKSRLLDEEMKPKSRQLKSGFGLLICILLSGVKGWVWECTSGSCKRRDSPLNNTFYNNLEICRLVCGDTGNIWPLPVNYTAKNKSLVYIDVKNVAFSLVSPIASVHTYLQSVTNYFKEVINQNDQQDCLKTKYKLVVNVNVTKSNLKLNYQTSEENSLVITTNASTVKVNIAAVTIFGARHALETLLQLIEIEGSMEQTCYVTLKEVTIQDKPTYKHRGLLLDSARNFLSIDVIKKNIVAMGMSKLNTLHWHLSDTQSFPFVSARVPNMSSYGAYSAKQTYSPHEIRDLLQFAKLHGVRIVPEIDGPAHAGSGWQWGSDAGLGDLVVCYNQLPYKSFCIQPPCGQMNPANPNLYNVLGNIYADIIDLWADEIDLFHMGGDEVYIPCWNSTKEIVDYIGRNRSSDAFHKLWSEFQQKALAVFDAANVDANTLSNVVLWSSTLTNITHVEEYISKNRYIIQTWVPKSDSLPKELLNLGYKLIISTKDSWYLDHGFWGSTHYYTWRTVYDNTIPTGSGILGGEVCMWGELVDDYNVESRVWPRAAAAAERLWSNPSTTSIDASARFFSHNDRLAKRGVKTSPVIPEYCSQSNNDCTGYLTK